MVYHRAAVALLRHDSMGVTAARSSLAQQHICNRRQLVLRRCVLLKNEEHYV